jgi:hypothetical protein
VVSSFGLRKVLLLVGSGADIENRSGSAKAISATVCEYCGGTR